MKFIVIFLVAIALIGVAFAGLAIRVLIEKKGKFPNLHISSNKHMKQRGVTCVQSFDKAEQAKARKEFRFKELTILKDAKGS